MYPKDDVAALEHDQMLDNFDDLYDILLPTMREEDADKKVTACRAADAKRNRTYARMCPASRSRNLK